MQPLELSDNLPISLEKRALVAPAESASAQAVSEALPRPFERFTLLARVARGGMGEVYLAAARSIEGAERPLIVKIIRPDHAEDRSFVARFLDEARIQSQLQHPGVAQILEATIDTGGKPYVVVEYVEGRNLSEVRTRAGQLGVRVSWPEALALSVCLGEALTHVHERTDHEGRPLEIVHRDLSPQNVMVGYAGDVKLIDFGTARGQNRRSQTISGIVFAKPGYVAPEVANNSPGGVPADLYAFGVILWELLAGRRFLTGEATAHLAAVGSGKRTLPPLARIVGAPAEIDLVLAKLAATRIEDRFTSARAATQEIVKMLQRAPSLADGDRSVRGRISDLMRRLYPAEPARSRAEFARCLTRAKSMSPRMAPAAPLLPPPEETTDPSLLSGTRYRLVRELGRGASGVVHEAVHLDLGRTVALKILETEAMSAEGQSRFRAEARAIAQLSHENLVKVFEFGTCKDGRPFYAMELLDGETLATRLDRERRVPVSAAVDFGIQACRALEAAHRAGVVHRDVKPANLFVTNAGTLKVLDFGVAKVKPCSSLGIPNEAAGGEGLSLSGTPEYMAPEQAQGQADERSDVYGLGVVLYELLTGNLPFDAEGPLLILSLKTNGAPPRPSQSLPRGAVPRSLDRAIARALDANPERRFETAAALRRALENVLTEAPRKQLMRRRAGMVVAGALLCVCSGVLITAFARSPSVRSYVQQHTEEARGSLFRAVDRARERRAALLASKSAEPRASELAVGDRAPLLKAPLAASPGVEKTQTEPEASTNSEEAAQAKASETSDEVHAVLEQANALSEKGRDLKALDLLRKSAETYADDPALLAALTHSLQRNRSWGDALKVARRRAELDPSVEARLELARIERATGHRDRAIALLTPLVSDQQAGGQARELLRVLTGGGGPVALRD